ncbi:MAG: hypothetical protein LBL74_01730 [Bacteroidales bacterium]|nr:hypothetical protein [Bacteroidales bacterium]
MFSFKITLQRYNISSKRCLGACRTDIIFTKRRLGACRTDNIFIKGCLMKMKRRFRKIKG